MKYRTTNHQKRKARQKLNALIGDYFFTDFEEINRRKRRGITLIRSLIKKR